MGGCTRDLGHFGPRQCHLTDSEGLMRHGRSRTYLSAGVKDGRLGAGREKPAGAPDREALPLRQLDGWRQDQGLLPGAVPRQGQLGAGQRHRQLLTTGTVRESVELGRKLQTTAETRAQERPHARLEIFISKELKRGFHTAVQAQDPHQSQAAHLDLAAGQVCCWKGVGGEEATAGAGQGHSGGCPQPFSLPPS